jgi:hypothetical protein
MGSARGRIVAITTAHFVPAPDWIERICEAHERLASPGIGGAIDPPRGGRAADWATYFLRYSTLFEFEREQTVSDFSGDNASYKRPSLTAHWSAIEHGFWEPDFHRLVLASGESLTFVPEIRITQRGSFGIPCFCAQRLSHGRHFGRERMRGKPLLFCLAGIAAAPLIPFVLVAKILRRITLRPSYFPEFLWSLPVLLMFIFSWALGETSGYLSAAWDHASSLSARRRVSA